MLDARVLSRIFAREFTQAERLARRGSESEYATVCTLATGCDEGGCDFDDHAGC
jgi:hypothetical protein